MADGIDYNLLAGMGRSAAASHQAGLESRLVMDRIAQDETTRNVLGAYLEAPPEERDARLNALVGADPKMAADVLTIEHARADRAQLQRRQHATAALTELQAIRKSQNPGLAFRLMIERPDEDNALRGLAAQLQERGVINLEDGISDEEAATITDLAITQLTPIADAQDVERADPADVRAMQLLGYELTPQGFAQYNADKGAGEVTVADQLGAIQAQLAIDQRRDQLERDRAADETARTEADQQREQTRNSLRRGIEQTAKIADLTQKLEGSFLQAGMPASSWRRTAAGALAGLGAAAGIPTDKLRHDLDQFDQLKKNLSDQLINLMSTGKGLSQGTNAILEQYQNALASTETSPGAVMAIQANIARILLDEADAQKIDAFEGTPKEVAAKRAAVEANIEKWRSYATPAGEAVVDAPAIAARVREVGNMTASQLKTLLSSAEAGAEEYSEEVLEAAAQRWEELNAAPGK